MAWEIDRHGKPRYVHKQRINGHVVSKVLGRDVVGRIAHEAIVQQRAEYRQLREDDLLMQDLLDEYELVVNQIFEQSLIASGYICRNRAWHNTGRLRIPLTSDEQALIDSVLATVKTPLPRSMAPKEYPT